MRKKLIMTALMLAAVSLTACGGGKDIETTGAAAGTAAQADSGKETAGAGPESAEAGAEEEGSLDELQYFEGIVTAFDVKTMTVASDDGITEVFDISAAEDDDENDEKLICGCYVETGYFRKDSVTGLCRSEYITILSGMEDECDNINVNPFMKGSITFFDENSITIRDLYGDEYEFVNNIANFIGFDTMKEGMDVTVTYYGTVYDKENGLPVALKIVADDALATEAAEADYITGAISAIDGGSASLETEVLSLGLWGDEKVFADAKEEEIVRVFITGAIRNDSVECVKIEPAG